MKNNEKNYYNEVANWSFNDIDYITESYTKWIYEEEIEKRTTSESKILDLGTAAGEKVLKYFPDCAEILGTDFSEKMIASANRNLLKSKRKNISFRLMDNLHMDTPDNYFDIVTARHTKTDPKQIFKTLKEGGFLIIRGVDKLDCWYLKRKFGKTKGQNNSEPISLREYEAIIDAGFKEVELIPIHDIEYYRTKEDLYALLMKVPILEDFSKMNSKERLSIDDERLNEYIKENMTDKGIKLIRRYYGIIGKK